MTEAHSKTIPAFFERDLIAEAARLAEASARQAEMCYTKEDMEKAKAEAFEQGREAAEQALLVQQNEALLAANRSLALIISDLLGQVDKTRTVLIEETVDLAMLMARALAGAALEALPDADILALIKSLFNEIREESRLEITGHFSDVPDLEQRLEAALKQEGFEGRLIVRHRPEAQPFDVRLAWGQGGVDLNKAVIDGHMATVLAQLKHRLASDCHQLFDGREKAVNPENNSRPDCMKAVHETAQDCED